jgi:hypothetical protein
MVTFSSLADFNLTQGPNAISREDRMPTLTVFANTEQKAVFSVGQIMQARMENVSIPKTRVVQARCHYSRRTRSVAPHYDDSHNNNHWSDASGGAHALWQCRRHRPTLGPHWPGRCVRFVHLLVEQSSKGLTRRACLVIIALFLLLRKSKAHLRGVGLFVFRLDCPVRTCPVI